ncbi:MAG: DNRLRE domain-containing protein [Chloroflexota bacterium]
MKIVQRMMIVLTLSIVLVGIQIFIVTASVLQTDNVVSELNHLSVLDESIFALEVADQQTPDQRTTSSMVTSQKVISATRDAFIIEASPNNNTGRDDQMWAGGGGAQSMRRRGLVYFDVAAHIPSGMTILTVTVHFEVVGGPSGGGVDSSFRLNRLTKDWQEGNKSGQHGDSASTGAVTWSAAQHNVVSWTLAGGDFVSTPSAETPVSGLGLYTWQSTPALVSDVQSWLDTPTTNYGWILRSDNEFTNQTVRRFGTHDGKRPAKITVDYAPPQAVLNLTKTASHDIAKPGDVITYTIVVANSGSLSATQVTVIDTLPVSVTQAASPTISPSGSGTGFFNGTGSFPVLVDNVTILPGKYITITLPVTIASNISNGTVITNTASVTHSQATSTLVDSATTVVTSLTERLFLPLSLK